MKLNWKFDCYEDDWYWRSNEYPLDIYARPLKNSNMELMFTVEIYIYASNTISEDCKLRITEHENSKPKLTNYNIVIGDEWTLTSEIEETLSKSVIQCLENKVKMLDKINDFLEKIK